MQCANCGKQIDPASGECGCGTPMPQAAGADVPGQRPAQPISVPPHHAPSVPPLQPAPPVQRLFTRPPGYPTFVSWIVTGMFRNRRGTIGAFIAAWFNLPLAVFVGGLGIVYGGIAGYFGGFTRGNDIGPEFLMEVPLLGSVLSGAVLQVGGLLGLLVGVVLGALTGFFGGLFVPWALVTTEPVYAVGYFVAQIIVAVLLGLLYTVYGVATEGWRFRAAGCREPSRREKELLLPILVDCAMRLQLNGHPKLLVDDSREANAVCGTRHIVISRGLLDEFDYDPEPIAAVLCHELTHWRNADPVSGLFIRGLGLPLYLAYVFVTWLRRTFRHPLLSLVLGLGTWPLLLTVRYFVMPMQAAGSRAAEYLADQGAIWTGHHTGLRQVLSRFPRSFDGARDGWERAVRATHPPNELRLEHAEAPGVDYPLPDRDSPARPLPVVVSSSQPRD
ncbi:M48 family metalloprotease [Salinispora arenicola]|uniref:M48 family metalloprotease n=1 Tax=Salinispora arenicola TaxID=168697 RepID=UPI00207AB8A7|nr:M48 family metalloprotease [Salinispora arenicola]MCN0180320.1 M48 family metalloprotease [Salinispora arenicola]